MIVDVGTRVIGRFHSKDSGTGLNIYNPYYQSVGINAVYTLFKNDDPEILIAGMRSLGLVGAITAGFESDPRMPELVDEVTEWVRVTGRVGVIANREGKLIAHYQGGEGLLAAIQEKAQIHGRHIVLVGAGTVAKALILSIEKANIDCSITVVNRTISNAEYAKEISAKVISILGLDSLSSASGDILVNTTKIGSSINDDYFTKECVKKFDIIADVTFGNPNTNLITLARQSGKMCITGNDMFTHQAAVILDFLLGHKADISALRKYVEEGLSV
jgi:shikimate 5-dehydrogenase